MVHAPFSKSKPRVSLASLLSPLANNGPCSIFQVQARVFVGPLFVSIGNSKKLNKFLELNPQLPRNQAFVDGYDFGVYQAVGLQKMELGYDPPKGALGKGTAPKLGGVGGWLKYLKAVSNLAPFQMNFPKVSRGICY